MQDNNHSDNKRKAGRPDGSVTCRRVKLKVLQQHVAAEGTVLASQSWLKSAGIPYKEDTTPNQ